MARKEIGVPLDRKNRNNHNDNFKELYDDFKNVVDRVSDEAFDKVISGSKIDWDEMVDSADDLPSNVEEGETRGVKSDNKIYRYDGSKWIPIAEINLNPIAEVDERLTTQLADIAKDVNDRGINIRNLNGGNLPEDITLILQAALNSYNHVFVPEGAYQLGDLSVKNDTLLVFSEDTTIDMYGVIRNDIESTKKYSKDIVGNVQVGDKKIKINDTIDVAIGDTVLVYNGGWIPESEWLEQSKTENPYRTRKQIAIVESINGNELTFDRELNFDINLDRITPRIDLFNHTKNINIIGGSFRSSQDRMFEFVNVVNLNLSKSKFVGCNVNTPIFAEYAYDSEIAHIDAHNSKNSFLWLARMCNNVKVINNNIDVEDQVSRDATIIVYDACTNVTVANNRLNMYKKNPLSNPNMSGINIHTDSLNCTVMNNEITGFYYGIASHFSSKKNSYLFNKITHCAGGIALHGASYETVKGNVINYCGLDESAQQTNRGGIIFLLGYPSYRCIINGNVIYSCWKAVKFNSKNTGSVISENLIVDWVNRAIDSEDMDFKEIKINNNLFRLNGTKKEAIKLLGNWVNCVINDNNFDNTLIAITAQQLVFGFISGNVVKDTNLFVSFLRSSKYNQVVRNFVIDSGTAFSKQESSAVNNFNDNNFSNVKKTFDFTDVTNLSTSALNDAPIGFKIHSINPDKKALFYEKVSSDIGHGGWRRVAKGYSTNLFGS